MTDYVRGEDVLDIWFDSGTSWAAVLQGVCVLNQLCGSFISTVYISQHTHCVFL